jgi:hypothetical protein
MTAGILEAPIYQGAKWEHLLTFTDDAGDTLNLTGLNPFVFAVAHPQNDKLLLTGTVTNTNLSGGQITVTLTAAQTNTLKTGYARIGLRDNLNNPYIANRVPVICFPPDPA